MAKQEQQRLERYNSELGATNYTGKFSKHWWERINNRTEQSLLAGILDSIPTSDIEGLALDMPCGYGRMHPLLNRIAPRIVESDWSFFMLQESRRLQGSPDGKSPAGFVRASGIELPYKDRAFDIVLSVRLCHHISIAAERQQYVRDLCRISNRWIVFTYFDSHSIKNRNFEFARKYWKQHAHPKWTMSRDEVADIAREAGYDVKKSLPLSRFFSGHIYSVLRRSDD